MKSTLRMTCPHLTAGLACLFLVALTLLAPAQGGPYDGECPDCEEWAGSVNGCVPVAVTWMTNLLQCPELSISNPPPGIAYCADPPQPNSTMAMSVDAPGLLTQLGKYERVPDPEECDSRTEHEIGFDSIEWEWEAEFTGDGYIDPSSGTGDNAVFDIHFGDAPGSWSVSVDFTATGTNATFSCTDQASGGVSVGSVVASLSVTPFLGLQITEDLLNGVKIDPQGADTGIAAISGIPGTITVADWTLNGPAGCVFDPAPPPAMAPSVTFKETGATSPAYLNETVAVDVTFEVNTPDGTETHSCSKSTNCTVVAIDVGMPVVLCGQTNIDAVEAFTIDFETTGLPDDHEIELYGPLSGHWYEDAAKTIPAKSSYPVPELPMTLFHNLYVEPPGQTTPGTAQSVSPGTYILKANHSHSRADYIITYEIIKVEIEGPSNACVQCEIQLATTGGDAPYQWISSDPSVASVDANGLVTGLSPGQTIITATDKNGCEGKKLVFVPKFELLMTASACDGLVVPIKLMVDPAHVKQHIVAVNFSATKPDGSTSFDNPDGQGIAISQVGQDWTTWQIDNVRWYSTQPDHCNDTSRYKIQASVTLDTCANCKPPDYSFTANMTPGQCFDGGSDPYSYWNRNGNPIYITGFNANSGLYETSVAQGAFWRDVQANSWWRLAPDSQYHTMIMKEEVYHETQQMENPNHVRWGTCFLPANVMNQVRAGQPYVHSNSQQSLALAERAFGRAKIDEERRSIAYLGLRFVIWDDEVEAKSAVGASHRATLKCTYWFCP
jgi:Big-like domain-containing protein